eukprot:CAMPEP_0183352942 /NCGR_PEP_ID=MMETSP0164_2-20130417/31720_1 /TAXON_ID=221442 /ORGANISM="Coccolithus pelagicus ssp braarudi, Strain PLY182g" /LENGTH=58 /DNA_ID=CAMNT_0025525519 /DNA_START=533 /DNA_END=706 /DNA_ORIENTATION=-
MAELFVAALAWPPSDADRPTAPRHTGQRNSQAAESSPNAVRARVCMCIFTYETQQFWW